MGVLVSELDTAITGLTEGVAALNKQIKALSPTIDTVNQRAEAWNVQGNAINTAQESLQTDVAPPPQDLNLTSPVPSPPTQDMPDGDASQIRHTEPRHGGPWEKTPPNVAPDSSKSQGYLANFFKRRG